jgi:nucleoside-diphosphate-sugar epimerase
MGKIRIINADLSSIDDCRRVAHGVDIIFNLAGKVGGIGYQVGHHGTAYLSNVLVNLALLEAARLEGVERYQCTSSTCVYSRENSANAREEDAFVNDPEPTVFGYGWAKRMAEIQARLYAEEYGMKIAIVRPANTFGPRDDFSEQTSHVIPAIIARVFESDESITIWGSGNQTRSFVYVQDVVRGMMDATEKYAIADPINLGSDEEVTIRDLVHSIIRLFGKKLDVRFDSARPQGQPRKYADIAKARRAIGWAPSFTLEQGLAKTISWYKENVEDLSRSGVTYTSQQ